MHLFSNAPPILRIIAFLNWPHAVIQQRFIKEARPKVQHFHRLALQILEAPDAIGFCCFVEIPIAHGFIQHDHAAHEARFKNPHHAEIKQSDAEAIIIRQVRTHLVIAEMRVAMNHTIAIERHIPGAEQGAGIGSAFFLRRVFVNTRLNGAAIQPGHGQQALGAKGFYRHGHAHARHITQHDAVKPLLRCFAQIIQFLAQAFGKLKIGFLILKRAIHATIEAHGDFQLPEVSLHHARHIRVLQLAGHALVIRQHSAMHLAEGRRGGGFTFKGFEFAFPSRAQFAHHAPAHKGPAHGRRIGLKRRQFLGDFGRQRIRHGGEELRDLHHGPLQGTQHRLQILGMFFV